MKIVAFALFFVGFATLVIDAASELPNGGNIYGPDGKYIPGTLDFKCLELTFIAIFFELFALSRFISTRLVSHT